MKSYHYFCPYINYTKKKKKNNYQNIQKNESKKSVIQTKI